ncbi:hypothetical protein KUCAC02_021459, partial [Chaenocephalus aceratus]
HTAGQTRSSCSGTGCLSVAPVAQAKAFEPAPSIQGASNRLSHVSGHSVVKHIVTLWFESGGQEDEPLPQRDLQ